MQPAFRALWWVLAVVVTLMAIFSLWWPYAGDQMTVAWVADVLLHGGRPYLDAWDQNAPGAALQQALLQALFGKREAPLRVLDLLYLGLTCYALVRLGQRVHSPQAGAWAAVFFGLLYLGSSSWATAQRDGYAAMASTWALWLATSGSVPLAGLAGLLVAWATLCKPSFVAMVLPVVAAAYQAIPRDSGVRNYTGPLTVAASFAVGVGACLLWLAANGALAEAYRCVVEFNLGPHRYFFGTPATPAVIVRKFVQGCAGRLPLVALAAAGIATLFQAGNGHRWSVGVLWPAAVAASLLCQGLFHAYHWHGLWCALSLLAGVGLSALVGPANARLTEVHAPAAALVLLTALGAAYEPCRFAASTFRWWAQKVGAGQWVDQSRVEEPLDMRDHREVASYVRSRTQTDEPIQAWAFIVPISFLADRPSATRFGYAYPLMQTKRHLPELHRAYVEEFLEGLRRRAPSYFVVRERDAARLREISPIRRYVEQEYVLETKISGFFVLRRRSLRSDFDGSQGQE